MHLIINDLSLPGEHVDCGNAHVSVDCLPRLDEPVQLAVGQRTGLVDLEMTLKVAASYFVHRVVIAMVAVDAHCRCSCSSRRTC